jgi:hypothetical protein
LQPHQPATTSLDGLELAASLADLVAQGLDSNAADARSVLQADQRGLALSLKQLQAALHRLLETPITRVLDLGLGSPGKLGESGFADLGFPLIVAALVEAGRLSSSDVSVTTQCRKIVGERPAYKLQNLLCGVFALGHRVARPAGIEPATPAFGGQYSIH